MTISDIVNDIYFRTKTNSANYLAADMLIHINRSYNRVASLIIQADGRWQWDDNNQADLAIATTSIVANQQDYSITTAHLKLLRAQILPNNSTIFLDLVPKDIENSSLDTVTKGVPGYYDKLGLSLFLEPIPNYSQAASLKLYFQRGPAEFTSGEVSTGTKQPGFNSLYHSLIVDWVAYDYAVATGLPQASGWLQDIVRKEAQLKIDYGKRDPDDRSVMTMKKIKYI